ncbi:hypothetical protein DICVIV_09070 [Dictyocaulus viviparus]|uniref:Uncharacterized protein n=1 Tax=Dictyocaulus viviparus TaxID=29172 RepID=A0A0D8XM56_DICVI|nr:hypothetical protein DICVIV_09070 [Dictyocaulus viviparus]
MKLKGRKIKVDQTASAKKTTVISQPDNDFVEKRAGGRAFIPANEERDAKFRYDGEKRSKSSAFDNHKRLDDLAFMAYKRGGGRSFNNLRGTESRTIFDYTRKRRTLGARGSSPFELQDGEWAVIPEKRGGARIFRSTTKRDMMDEYPDWILYEDSSPFDSNDFPTMIRAADRLKETNETYSCTARNHYEELRTKIRDLLDK